MFAFLQTAWAQGTGMRESNYKDTWDVDAGAMYIPWNKLPLDMTAFLEGSIIDTESLPEHLKGRSGFFCPVSSKLRTLK